MSKPKKGNKNQHNKGYSFNEALLQYNVKNYTGTLMRLKTADIKPHEVERANNLKQATLLRLAYTDFSNYHYEQALQRLQLLPTDNLIGNALTGIIYLYQNDYEKAAPLFKKLIQNTDYQNFTVYYLLAELYVGQPEKYDDFKNWHAPLFAQCTPFQQDYIHIAFYIIRQEFDHALNLVNLTKGASHAQQSNIDALKQVLSTDPKAHQTHATPTTKALYRLLLDDNLQEFESAHFSQKQADSPIFTAIFKQQTSLTPELITELKVLCETGALLEEGLLARIIKVVPEAYRPYIVFNQAVNANNDKDFDRSLRGVKHIILTYPQYFVQVPESLTLYLNFQLLEGVKVYPNTFWQFFNQWLDIHKMRLSSENLDALGWLLYNILLPNAELVQGSYSRALINLYTAHPTMFSAKFAYIYFATFSKSLSVVFDKGALDLFTLPNAEKNKAVFAKILDETITELIDAPQRFGGMFGMESIPMSLIIKQIENLSQAFIQAVTLYETPPKNAIALETFKIINKHILQLGEKNHSFSAAFTTTFYKAYPTLLDKFPNNKTKEIYTQDLAASKSAAFKAPFLKLVRNGASHPEFNTFFKQNPAIDNHAFAWDIVCSEIGRTHFEAAEIPTIVEFIKSLFVKLGDSDALIQEAKNFVAAYKTVCERFGCEHPTEFYAQFLTALSLVVTLPPTLFYTFSAEFCLVFTTDASYRLAAKSYNAVGDFLEWLFRQKDRVPHYDKALIKQLIAYLEEVNKYKGLKKLETTLKKARVLAE